MKASFDYRHHTYKKTDHRNIELTEVGPRFEMKRKYFIHGGLVEELSGVFKHPLFAFLPVYMIKLGTLENESTADVEWRLHGYTHTAKKRRFLSVE